MAENLNRNYGYNVTTSHQRGWVNPANAEMNVYRMSEEQDVDGNSYHKKTNIVRIASPTEVNSNAYAGSHNISAVDAHLKIQDFLGKYPDAAPKLKPVIDPNIAPGVMVDNGHILDRDVQSEIAAAEEEARIIEAKRSEVALAVAGLDLATADHMAELAAPEQVAAIQE